MAISLQKSNQLKSIAILMMLFLHLFNRDHEGLFDPLIFIGNGGKPLTYYISLFSDACVPIFAFVSGYGLYFKYQENPKIYQKGNWRRLKKLYINYWIILFLFVLGLGTLLGKSGFPGSWTKFLLSFSGLKVSYNGAWWFLTTYIFFVLSSRFWFKLLDKKRPFPLLGILLLIYIIAFYFRIYKTNIFTHPFLNYLHVESTLYFATLFQFMLGAFALKYNWHGIITRFVGQIKYKNIWMFLGIIILIIAHGIVPNFIIAPFTALAFIFLFLQIDLSARTNRILDYFTPHSTNIWLIHMFIYISFFKTFIYGFNYVPLIFLSLLTACLFSSYVVNFFNQRVLQMLKIN